MLSTIHEAIMVETGKTDRDVNKIEKSEPLYYYCSRMGGVEIIDPSFQFGDSKCIYIEQALQLLKIDSG